MIFKSTPGEYHAAHVTTTASHQPTYAILLDAKTGHAYEAMPSRAITPR